MPSFCKRLIDMDKKRYSATVEEKSRIKSEITAILTKVDDIQFSYVYGSFLDENMPFHDIDLGVFFAGKNKLQMSEIAIDLAIILSKKASFPVDVRVLNHAPVSFVYNAMRGELIYERNADVRCRIMEYTVRNYLDMKPILYQATKEAFSHEPQP
jgi:hypothetical protein